MPKRATSTSFQPGKSGNPGGRPKVFAAVRELAQEHGPEAIDGLLRIARDNHAPAAARVAAYNAILDRAYGRPHQEVTQHLDDQRAPTTDADRAAENARLLDDMRRSLSPRSNGEAER